MIVKEALKAALDHYTAGKLQHSRYLCIEILKLGGDNFDALFLLGVINYEEQDYDSAIECYQKMLTMNSLSAEVHYNLANAFRKKGLFVEAVAHYLEALRLDPVLFEACHNLGIIMVQERRMDEAIAYFRKVITLNPDFYNAYYYLGILLQGKGQLEDSINCFRKSERKNIRFIKIRSALRHSKIFLSMQSKNSCDELIKNLERPILARKKFHGARDCPVIRICRVAYQDTESQ